MPKDIDALEAELDAEYARAGQSKRSWEVTASHMVLAHAYSATRDLYAPAGHRGDNYAMTSLENWKYGAMHTFRFLHKNESRPIRGLRAFVDSAMFAWARGALERGLDYDAIVGGFTQFRAGAFRVGSLTDQALEFVPLDDSSMAYDLVDQELHVRASPPPGTRDLARRVDRLATKGGGDAIRALQSGSDIATAVDLCQQLLQGALHLPDGWSYEGVSISSLRRFWSAVLLTAMIQSRPAAQQQSGEPTWNFVIRGDRREITKALAGATGMADAEVTRIMGWHSYERTYAKSDIALTPFVDTGGALIACPMLILSGSPERNFYAHLARVNRAAVDASSHLLAPAMQERLAESFRKRGFLVRTGIAFTSSAGNGDIDLLVWSPGEAVALAMELKWYIAPGDYREVLNRNEAAEESLKRQLPKYTAALREHGRQLIGDAFGQVALADRITWSCGLVMKNHVGTAKLRVYTDAWFAPESALVAQLTRCDNLRQLVSNMKQFIWVPPRAKMIIRKNTVVTPSGFELVMPGYELPETPSNVVAFWRWRS